MDIRPFASRLTKCCCLCLFLLAANVSFGQDIAGTLESSRVEIIKLQWKREVRLPRNFDPSVIPTNGAFSDPARSSATTSTSIMSDATRAASSSRSTVGDAGNAFPATPGRLPVYYVYSMKIRNLSSQTIAGVAWDYVFIDPDNKKEVIKHQFLSYTKVGSNKTSTLQGQLRTPPMRILRASDSGRTRLLEQGVIQCVLYADDTVWKNPRGRDGVCEFLKTGKLLLKQKHAKAEP